MNFDITNCAYRYYLILQLKLAHPYFKKSTMLQILLKKRLLILYTNASLLWNIKKYRLIILFKINHTEFKYLALFNYL